MQEEHDLAREDCSEATEVGGCAGLGQRLIQGVCGDRSGGIWDP